MKCEKCKEDLIFIAEIMGKKMYACRVCRTEVKK